MPIWSVYVRYFLLLLDMFESVVNIIISIVVIYLYCIKRHACFLAEVTCITSLLDFIQIPVLCRSINSLLLFQTPRVDLFDDLKIFYPLFFRVINDMNGNIIVESDSRRYKLLK
jgi:hypothetical protein